VRPILKVGVTFWTTLPAFYGLWLFFVGTFSLHELLIGIIAASVASVGMVVVTIYYQTPFSPTISDLLALWRIPWYLVSGTSEVLAVAGQDLVRSQRTESVFRVAPFDAGSEKNPRKTARRALAAVYTTIAPNFIVLGVNASNQKLLFHQIKRSSVPKMTEQLGAEA
jgi:multisubunit Na+/H+ antiporter MnhE subunit